MQDRIHLVNRYERLRVVDPEQAGRKRVSIHERLRLIDTQINQTLGQLAQFTTLQEKILPRISEYRRAFREANQRPSVRVQILSLPNTKK